MSRIYFYGSLPRAGESPFGGGEVGNMRTVRMLREANYDLYLFRKLRSKASWSRAHAIMNYPFRMLADYIKIIVKLLFASRKCVVHMSGFAGVTIMNEYVIMHLMKLLGYKVVYELRGGGAIGFWENGSTSYQKMFGYLLKSACYVFVQGKENIPLIESICHTPVFHYANCVEDGFAPAEILVKPTDRINMFYYGRCEENKHVDMIVEVAALVQKEIPNVYLSVVGNGQQSYIDMVKDKMERLLKKDSFSYLPGCKHENLPSMLMDKHFYIFPSTQPREGQSNSVTECMSFGIIPIASPQGFNRSTIGDDYLIVDSLDAEAYSNRIIEIIETKKIDYYSQRMFQRYQENYTEKVVFQKTLDIYSKLFETNS